MNNPHASYCDHDEMALKDAACEGDTDAIDRLCARGVNMDAHCKQEEHHPAIVLAAYHGRLKVVQSLIEKGADINEKTKCISYLSKYGHTYYGDTALKEASGEGHIKIVNELLRAGALVNEANITGSTPLMRAAFKGHPNIVNLLIHHGADVNQRNNLGDTALSLARKYNTGKTRRDLVRILKENGAKEGCPRSCLSYAPCIIKSIGDGISFLLSL